MKERRLKNDGVEGDADDDWQLVNCKTFLVHVMLPSKWYYSGKNNSTVSICYASYTGDTDDGWAVRIQYYSFIHSVCMLVCST
jgi:hypothetical protein